MKFTSIREMRIIWSNMGLVPLMNSNEKQWYLICFRLVKSVCSRSGLVSFSRMSSHIDWLIYILFLFQMSRSLPQELSNNGWVLWETRQEHQVQDYSAVSLLKSYTCTCKCITISRLDQKSPITLWLCMFILNLFVPFRKRWQA